MLKRKDCLIFKIMRKYIFHEIIKQNVCRNKIILIIMLLFFVILMEAKDI